MMEKNISLYVYRITGWQVANKQEMDPNSL